MGNIFEKFTGLYPVSKTLRFELKPQGKTLENMEKNSILNDDVQRASDYKVVKEIINDYHRVFISESLVNVKLSNLEEYYNLYKKTRDEDDNNKFQSIKDELKKELLFNFEKSEKWKKLFKCDSLIKDVALYCERETVKKDVVGKFNRFSTYFKGFIENRKNMYSNESKSTSIFYRIIDENLPKFLDNVGIFESCKRKLNDNNLSEINDLCFKMMGANMDSVFSIEGFNLVLTQEGIDKYNYILGGYSLENGVKFQGLNEFINLHNQTSLKQDKIGKMKVLFKQILSHSSKLSFVEEILEKDDDVIDSILSFYNSINELFNKDGKIYNLFNNFGNFNLEKIYIKNDSTLTDYSNKVYGKWNCIKEAIVNEYDISFTEKEKNKSNYIDKREKAIEKIKSYSINKIMGLMNDNEKFINYVSSQVNVENNLLVEVINKYQEASELLNTKYYKAKGLKSDSKNVGLIKDLLDAIKNLQAFLNSFKGNGDEDKDPVFYGELDECLNNLFEVNSLYNRVRNYITKKPYSDEKIKINFNCPTFLDGWDLNKETSNNGILLRKDGNYYLAVLNNSYKKVLEQESLIVGEENYEKINYKLIPLPSRDLPHIFMSKKGKDTYCPNNKIVKNFEDGTHKKGVNYCKTEMLELVNYFKESLKQYESWKVFEFNFSNSNNYDNIGDFYKEVADQGYRITYSNVSKKYIDDLVENNQLYLFQIYNKDYSTYSKGKKNLHTLYWEEVFSPENLKDVVYKLNGEAEVFYRKASINEEKVITHPANEPISNKGEFNTKKTSVFNYDLIKDRRYTVDKFQFHVPITMNFKATGRTNINQLVNDTLRNCNDVNIIGIDRGERNLLYICVINQKGEILEQRPLDKINNKFGMVDYNSLLDKKVTVNNDAKKSWNEIQNIKELKSGFLSQAITEIVELMIKYNAFIVLEDLNFGFMNGRKKIGKEVYKKFESALINKLNYYVNKNVNEKDYSGLLKAYQLTSEFKSFEKLGRQTGFLYYVQAWNTSKIDPVTGFVNLFNEKYESIDKAIDFFNRFDDIKFNNLNDYFEFSFDYKNFEKKVEAFKSKWVACSYGNRIKTFRDPNQNNEFNHIELDLTAEFKMLFDKFNINYNDNLKNQIINMNSKEFFEQLFSTFRLMMQMRNSNSTKYKDVKDYIISPILNNGKFYMSGVDSKLPMDADANGAYNIARKGLILLNKINNSKSNEKIDLSVRNKEWLEFAQK